VKRIDIDRELHEQLPCYEFGAKGSVEYGFALSSLAYLDFAEFSVIDLGRLVAGCDVALRFDCHLCQSNVFLEYLYRALVAMGVTFRVETLSSLSQVAGLDASVVFNCLGYQSVFPDEQLYAVLGQSMYIPVPACGPTFGLGAGEHAVFCHSRGVHIGAFFIPGRSSPSPRRELYDRSVAFVEGPFRELCSSVGLVAPILDFDDVERVNVGIRPFRPAGPRVERDKLGQKIVIHNYGHGAHGWTLGYGSALEAAKLAQLV
jgi:glycine/D-amino acid oxidase-like deaminating enzyme